MIAPRQILSVLLLMWLAAGCDENQLSDISPVIEANCERNLSCGEDETLDECAQSSNSILAAFEHVYGDLCLDAWVAVLDCETQQPCDVELGCEAENFTLDNACGFADPESEQD
jgi:hypothetical protein